MTQNHLPREDQPGDYTGCWNQVYVRTVYPDTSTGVWHLGLPEEMRGSYCGAFNPLWRCILPGMPLTTTHGGTVTVGTQGVTVGQLIRGMFKPWKFRGTALTICPDCLTMARAQAELISQPKYRLRGLLKQFDGTNTPPA